MNKNTIPTDLHDITPENIASLIHLNTVTITNDMCKISNDGTFSLNNNGKIALKSIKAFNYYKVIIPEKIKGKTITGIKNATFKDLNQITSILLPKTVTSIGMYAFLNCESLININVSNSINKIGKGAFEYCKNLESEMDLSNVSHIENSTFKGCYKLPKVILSNNIISIGNHAFDNCKCFKVLHLPDSVKFIDERTFKGCYNLNIYYAGLQSQLDTIISSEVKEYLSKYNTKFISTKEIDLNNTLKRVSVEKKNDIELLNNSYNFTER